MTVEELAADFDWQQVFKYANPEQHPWGWRPSRPITNSTVSQAPFTPQDVAAILAIKDGQNDGIGWLGIFLLKDGRFALLTAGCDYTGWG